MTVGTQLSHVSVSLRPLPSAAQTGSYLRVEYEAAGPGHGGDGGGAGYRHGDGLADHAVGVAFCLLAVAPGGRAQRTTRPTPLVMRICWQECKKRSILADFYLSAHHVTHQKPTNIYRLAM